MDYKLIYQSGKSPAIPFVKFQKIATSDFYDTFVIETSPTLTYALSGLGLAGFSSAKVDPEERLEEMLHKWAGKQNAIDQLDCTDLVNQIVSGDFDPMSLTTYLQYHDVNMIRAEFNFGGICQIYHAGGDALQTTSKQ